MGASLGFEGTKWNTIEGGKGGPSSRFDQIVRWSYDPYPITEILGWVDFAAIYDHEPATVSTSPANSYREQIFSGRGGVGMGKGTWTGTGITSNAAAAANAAEPESYAIGYADNASLPLGR
jgi:hypothetical protein